MRRLRRKGLGLLLLMVLCFVWYQNFRYGSILLSGITIDSQTRPDALISMQHQAIIKHSSSILQRLVHHEDLGGHATRVRNGDKPTSKMMDSSGQLEPRDRQELTFSAVPNTVFYVWCQNKTFEYNHYLSIRSVWQHMEPDVITLYYRFLPKQDEYNDWLELLRDSIPNLVLSKMTGWLSCKSIPELLLELMSSHGGVYLSSDTVLLRPINYFRKKNLTVYMDAKDNLKLLLTSARNPLLNTLSCFQNASAYQKPKVEQEVEIRICQPLSSTFDNRTAGACAYLISPLYPKGIISDIHPIASLLRYSVFGQMEPIIPRTSPKTRIPKIVHYVWYHRSPMTFMMYLSVLSSLHVIKAETVYIHGGNALEGSYFDMVQNMSRVTIIKREAPLHIFGNRVYFTHHKSDVMRGDILYKYGGIYMDWDALWLKPIDDLLSVGYDVIVGLDHLPRPPFPDSINMGVVISKPRAKFIELWRNTYKNYKSNRFYYNPVEAPYKLYENYPHLVKIEPRLQVMCFYLKCHPTFHPNYKDLQNGQPFDWKSDAYAIHFTHPDPEVYNNEEALRHGSGMFAEIGKYILKLYHD